MRLSRTVYQKHVLILYLLYTHTSRGETGSSLTTSKNNPVFIRF